jgi:hypothetical protein
MSNILNLVINVLILFGTFISIVGGIISINQASKSRSKAVQNWKRRSAWSFLAALLLLSVLVIHLQTPSNSPSQPGSQSKSRNSMTNTPIGTISPTNLVAAELTGTATAQAHEIYEAEGQQNTLDGGAYVEMCPRCSNGRVVFNIGVAPNVRPGTLQFNNVYAAKDGNYWMIVTYCGHYSFDNYAYISVNGGQAFKIHYQPAGDCLDKNATLGNLFVSVSLHQGNNTIKFSNPYAYSSYIDKITIQPLS